MSVLVTGGAGYIGSQFLHTAMDEGIGQLVVIDDLSSGTRAAVPENIPFYQANVADVGALRHIFLEHEIDTIVHFAGSIIVPESVDNPLKYYKNNTCNSRKLIEAAISFDIRNFVFSSTAAVYGKTGCDRITETHLLAPISPYGASKLMTEQMLADVGAAHNLKFMVLRYFNVAGADPLGRTGQRNPGATHLIKRSLRASMGQESRISVFGNDYDTPDGSAMRDFIHVSDLCRAHVAAINHLRNGGNSDILNCGYGEGVSVFEVIECVKRLSGTEFEVRIEPRRKGDVASVISDPTRLFQKLGWLPERATLEEIIGDALAWEKSQIIESHSDLGLGSSESAA